MEVAASYTKSHNLNTITLEGDKYDRKGAMTGGYIDAKQSRLDAAKNVKIWQERYDTEAKDHAEAKQTIVRLDQEITQLVGQLQVIQGKKRMVSEEREPLVAASMSAQDETERLRTRVTKLETQVTEHQSSIRNMKSEIKAYEAELKTTMNQTLSKSEVAQMATLTAEIAATQEELRQLSKDRSEVCSLSVFLLAFCFDRFADGSIAGSSRFVRTSSRVS